jgi:probable rRNA maturation factor
VNVVEEGGSSTAAKGLGRWLARAAPRGARGAVTVAIVGDTAMKRLNRTFRRTNKVTDVLSFPASAERPSARRRTSEAALGDIVIARGLARRQALSLGHPVSVELRVLALHGLLHLLGYDHETDGGRMARIESRLRRKAGLPAGLIARSS